MATYKTTLLCLSLYLFMACKKEKITVPDITPDPIPATPGTQNIAIDPVAQNLQLPWGLAYLPNKDLLFTQRNGKLSLLKNGETTVKLLMQRQVNINSEGGLLSITLDPDFSTNHYIYLYETIGTSRNRVVRLKFMNDELSGENAIVDNIPYGVNHDGGALKFGPDNYLYIGTGDVTQSSLAQDKGSLAGKILRVDRDGNAAPGNPFNSRIWSYGHRNVQGFTWMPNGKMLATEHGPSGENGWCCHDEINLIEPGRNYGWPLAYAGAETGTLTPSLINSGDDTWAPSGCTWLGANAIWPNCLVVASLRGQRLLRFYLNAGGTAITSQSDTLNGQFNRLRNVIETPQGLYFCTSNIGSISSPIANDDKIYRLYTK